MTRYLIAASHLFVALVTLGIMLNSMGWLLVFSAIFWVPVLLLHLYAIYRGTKAYPNVAWLLLLSTVGFLLFALARYDGGDTGGYTGLTSLLARMGLRDSAFVTGWEFLQLTYLYLFVQLFLDLKIVRAASRLRGAH